MPDPSNFALYYVDDSGSEASGYVTYSWVRVDPAHWAEAEQQWLAFRAATFRRHGIATSARLHATDLAGGRGHRSAELIWKRADGLEIIHDGLRAISALRGVAIGTVFRRTAARGRDFHRHKQEVYRCMVDRLNSDLGTRGGFGLIVMDGDGGDPSYVRTHRALTPASRRLIEDPYFRHASVSQWVQIADLAAWSAYHSLRPAGRRTRTSYWYADMLGHLDRDGGPVEV
ncbi:DUF3800 domain-containing protein [Plantactinospora siamensis]|uniref:DUF3800 domain-containing protein n=1 Tax=Plantactinospora siamensis TaxID=555372 RepID=A0ABV6NP92_9ACTN